MLFKSLAIAGLVWALALTPAAARSAKGVVPADPPSYVAAVEIVQHDTGAPPGFAEVVREAVLKEASFYGQTGQPLTLRIDIDQVHFKNAVKAMLIGDNNAAKGSVTVVDPATGQTLGTFKVWVDAERGGNGGEFALFIVGMIDPTGYVSLATTAGAAVSADVNRSGTAAQMIANFATDTLRQTYGDTQAKAARAAKKAHPIVASAPAPAPPVTAPPPAAPTAVTAPAIPADAPASLPPATACPTSPGPASPSAGSCGPAA